MMAPMTAPSSLSPAAAGASRGAHGHHGAAVAASASRRRQRRAVVLVAAAAAANKPAPAPAAPAAPPATAIPTAVYLDDAPTRAFVEWARTAAGVAGLGNKLKPATFAGLRGLAATAAAEEGDLLLSVPRASAITLPPKRRCPAGVPAAWWDPAPWYARLAALLLLEKRRVAAAAAAGGAGGNDAKDSSSRPLMAPYLATLPASFREMPYYWTDAQLDALRYPALQSAVREQRREWRQLHEAWVAAEAADTSKSKSQPPSLAELEWALSAVRSRTFSGPYVASTLASRGRLAALVAFLAATSAVLGGADGESLGRAFGAAVAAFVFNVLYETTLSGKLRQYVLCPAIDLLNHSSREGSEATYDYFRDSFSVSAASGGVAAAGRQVFGSYGAQTNDSLAQYYGFVERDNPHDAYVLTRALDWAEEIVLGGGEGDGGKGKEGRLAEAAARIGVAGELAAVRVAAGGGGFSDQAVAAMRRLLDEVVGGGESAEAVLAAVLRREMDELLSGGGGDGGGGGAGKKDGVASAPPALAREFRDEKKKILEACLERMVAGAG